MAYAASPDDLSPAQKRMLEASNRYALDNALRLIDPSDGLRLILVARQSAAGHSCEALPVDNDRFNAVMQSLVETLSVHTEDGQNNLPVDAVMAAYSTALGGHLAAAAYDEELYCATATALRKMLANEGSDRVLILK